MKKINLIFFLLLLRFVSFAQNELNNPNELEEIFSALPDSIFSQNIFDFSEEKRLKFWELYKKGEFKSFEESPDKIIGELNLFFDNDSFTLEALVNTKGKLLKIMNKYTDAIPTCDIKIFNSCNKKVIGVTIKSSDHATDHTDEIIFYEYENGEFINISHKVLTSFNYKKDNYSDLSINLISEIYGYDIKNNPLNRKLLYRFTPSDTVYISESFFGTDEELGLDEKYFDGEFYTKKYIMDKKKLKLAE